MVERCPLAHRGKGSELMAACPGFTVLSAEFEGGPGAGLGVTTCAHLGLGHTGRGYVASCRHPEAAVVVPAAREAAAKIPGRLELVGRRRRERIRMDR